MAALVAREVVWAWFPAALQGMASKGLGALLVLVLLVAVWSLSSRSRWLAVAMLYGAWSALQTVICSIAYMHTPWPVRSGQGICSARLDLDLGALGLLIAALFAMRASGVRLYRFKEQE